MRAILRGERLLPAAQAIEIVRSPPHGHVLATLGIARRIEPEGLLPRRDPERKRKLALALIIPRLLNSAAKLGTARMLNSGTACHSLGEELGLGEVSAKEVYAALDWLDSERGRISAEAPGFVHRA